ncbi:hypothetical protein SAMN04515660_0828 [Luteibacter sp. 329MFSha]|nr:hypothetical protein SAMN04515660_0828 [Luteibacter sp. 329MFSha]
MSSVSIHRPRVHYMTFVLGQSLVVSLTLLGGCARPQASMPAAPPPARIAASSYEALPAASGARYHMTTQQHASGAQPVANDPPAYPPGWIAANLPPVTIRAKVIVDGAGKVTEVRDLDDLGDPQHVAFFAATREAAMHWTYTPMTVVQDHEDARGNFSTTRSTSPFSLDYAFRFELRDGKPVVSATR